MNDTDKSLDYIRQRIDYLKLSRIALELKIDTSQFHKIINKLPDAKGTVLQFPKDKAAKLNAWVHDFINDKPQPPGPPAPPEPPARTIKKLSSTK